MIIIPEVLKSKLDENYQNNLLALVRLVSNKYDSILSNQNIDFFSEYTDHGIKHINEILESIENLLPNETLEELNSSEIAILIYSILLHDIGMLLTKKTFLNAIESDEILIDEFDNKSWKDLWENYLLDIKYASKTEKLKIFGKDEILISSPNFENLSKYDKLLITEFIRRHHPRLAHEISILGFELDSNNPDIIENLFDPNIKFISGLIARSHGMDLRSTFPYLKAKYGSSWKNPYGIRVIFLMAILRISDYIQIHASRAPQVILKGKDFSSEYSRKEWEIHNSIKFINFKTDDPELIYIQAEPKDCQIFLKIKNLLNSIQNELDTTWAILGEVFGQSNLRFKYRRISSNLDNVIDFAKTVDYIPEEIGFKTDPQILKLLIKPLYNNDSSIAVREIFQNSIDACNERRVLESNYIPRIKTKFFQKDGNYFLEIHDNGIGMTKRTLIDFFLKAGSSLRNSSHWLKTFNKESNNTVVRSGKFGIGVLSGFLLGDNVKIETRHFRSAEGYKIQSSFTSERIDVIKSRNVPIGTSWSIKINEENKLFIDSLLETKRDTDYKLKWFTWFLGKTNFFEFEIQDNLKHIFEKLAPNQFIPYDKNQIKNWHSFIIDNDLKVHWSISFKELPQSTYGRRRTNEFSLSHNGFRIKNGFRFKKDSYSLPYPRIAIEDRKNKVKVSLDRNSVYENSLPFEKALLSNIANNIVAQILGLKFKSCHKIRLPYFKNGTDSSVIDKLILFNEGGYQLIYPKEEIIEFWIRHDVKSVMDEINGLNTKYRIYRVSEEPKSSLLAYNFELFSKHLEDFREKKVIDKWIDSLLTINTHQIYLDPAIVSIYQKYKKSKKPSLIEAEELRFIDRSESLHFSTYGAGENILRAVPNSSLKHIVSIRICTAMYNHDSFPELFKKFSKYLPRNKTIPFSYEQRKKEFPEAFQDLGNIIENLRIENNSG